MVRKFALVLSAFAIVGCASIPHPPAPVATDAPKQEELEISQIALAHFATRADTNPYVDDGAVFVQPWTGLSSIGLNSMGDPQEQCPLSGELRSALIEKNKQTVPTATLFHETSKLQAMTEEDSENVRGVFVVSSVWKDNKIRTIAELARPVFSQDGKTAATTLGFRWSQHGAAAYYLFERVGAEWKIKCSALKFGV